MYKKANAAGYHNLTPIVLLSQAWDRPRQKLSIWIECTSKWKFLKDGEKISALGSVITYRIQVHIINGLFLF